MTALTNGILWSRWAHDTAPDAARVQVEAWRRMDPADRFRIALELSDAVRSLAVEGADGRRATASSSRDSAKADS